MGWLVVWCSFGGSADDVCYGLSLGSGGKFLYLTGQFQSSSISINAAITFSNAGTVNAFLVGGWVGRWVVSARWPPPSS